jgi:hypothetical protein
MEANIIHCVGRSSRPDTLSPLTPALSLGERGQRRQPLHISPRASLANALAMVLPLPEGEGRGEGEDSARQTVAPDVSKLAFCR